ncbi:MAG: phospholipase D family protein, partial [Luteimonas sp.]
MQTLRGIVLVALALLSTGCRTLSNAQRARATAIVEASRSTRVDCAAGDAQHCAAPSALRELGDRALAESAPESPRHFAVILDEGTDALLARINLLRSARSSIDLQTYIFDEDDAGRLVLDELMKAAQRGVRVRVLIDQLSALKEVDTLAALAGAHENFSFRIYNPVLGRARLNYPQYLLAAACCFRQLNRRMHSKLLLIDDAIGIVGGRNYQNDYYDWDPEFNFRDRDVLVAGPVAREMRENFMAFWESPRSRPVETLADVGRRLLRKGVPALTPVQYDVPQRAAAMSREAGDAARVSSQLVVPALPIGRAIFIADLPQKHRRERAAARDAAPSSPVLRGLIESAQSEVLMQTPYLVLSRPAQQLFRNLQERANPPRVVISSNSLASTDSFITYALAHKYKRRYLRDFGFEIYEYKPYPRAAPV